MASITLLRGADRLASHGKNGGGLTREIAVYPAGATMDAFTWRVSIAEVAQAGPFSCFAGVDRTLVLLNGAGIRLHEGSRTKILKRQYDAAHFAGETSINASLVDGSTRDLNLMVRRGAARCQLEHWRAAGSHALDADTALIYCTKDSYRVSVDDEEPIALGEGDTILIEQARANIVTIGSGVLLVIAFEISLEEKQCSACSGPT